MRAAWWIFAVTSITWLGAVAYYVASTGWPYAVSTVVLLAWIGWAAYSAWDDLP